MCAVVDHDSVPLIEVLLQYNARVDAEDNTGLTPIDAAAVLDKPHLLPTLQNAFQNPCSKSSFVYH
jgi:hypothetical protein